MWVLIIENQKSWALPIYSSNSNYLIYGRSHLGGISTKLNVNQALTVPECHQHHFPCWALHLEFSWPRFNLRFPNWTAGLPFRSPVMNPLFITGHYVLRQFGFICFNMNEESLFCHNSFSHFQDWLMWDPMGTNFVHFKFF